MSNPIHEAEREEWRSSLPRSTEVERARGCVHDWAPDRRAGELVCRSCGETERP